MSDDNGRFTFLRDPGLDRMIEDIITIFTQVEGVELVRLNGLTHRARRISGRNDIPKRSIDNIIRKLNAYDIIKYHYIIKCPHCGEVSYQIQYDGRSPVGPKICDTCKAFFQPTLGSTLEWVEGEMN